MRKNKQVGLVGSLLARALLGAAMCLAGVCPAAHAAQQQMTEDTIVPGLYGVGRVIIAPPVISAKPSEAQGCGIDPDAINTELQAEARDSGLPVPENDIGATRNDIFRLTITPEVTTLKTGAVNCVSWISLKAEASHTVRLPPIEQPKTVTVVYWSKGGLLITPTLEHGPTINLALKNLMIQFIKQWAIDNPHRNTGHDESQPAIPSIQP